MYTSWMAPLRTAVLNLRIDPLLKEALRTAAVRDHRSVANLVERLIREQIQREGIALPESGEMALEPRDE